MLGLVDRPDIPSTPVTITECGNTDPDNAWFGSDEYLILMGVLFALGLVWWGVRSIHRLRHHSTTARHGWHA